MQNPCKIIVSEYAEDKVSKIVQCEEIMNGVVSEGMTVAFNHHFDNMKYLEFLLLTYKENANADFVFPESPPMKYIEVTSNK